jgi:arabinofuranosyltransferase
MDRVESVGESRFPRWAWICLAAASLALLAHQVFYYRDLGGDAVDDAYISFRYAQNLIAGHGLVFNPGERVEGYTNFLWTIILALFMRLGLAPSSVAIALGVAFSLGTLWLVYLFWVLTRLRSPVIPVIAAWCLALDGSFALWAVSGMETSMFAFLVLAALTAYCWEWEKGKPGFLSGVLLALAAMTRPEGVLVLVVVVIHQAVARLVRQRRLFAPGDVARAGVFLGLYLPYFLWRYYYYGFLLPNTFYAKVTVHNSADQYRRGLEHVATFGRLHLGLVPPILVFVPLLKRRLSFWLTALLATAVAYVAYVVYVGGDWSVGRFFVPILPVVYILASAGAREAHESVEGWVRRLTDSNAALTALRWVAVAFLGVGGALLLASSSLHGEHELFVARFQAARATHARVELGKWLRENVPADTYIGVDAAGQIPYYAGLRTLDMFGVNDVHTAHLQVESMGQGVPGHEKFDFDYIMWRRPDLIIATAAFLDGSDIYERIEVPWTDDPTLYRFLFLYRRKGWSGWG